MIKPLYRLVLLAAVLAIAIPVTVRAASFPDVSEGTKYYGAVEYLKNKEIIQGYPDGSFKPDQTINRAEALKIIMLSITLEEESTITIFEDELPFPDVNPDDWFFDFVLRAFDLELVEGYPDGLFKPGNNINVAESIKIILLRFSVDLPEELETDPYADVKIDDWYSKYAQYAKEKQVIEPFDDGKLQASRDITRGEFALIIYRLLYVEENNLDVFPLSTNWPTYGNVDWSYTTKYPFDWTIIQADDQAILWKQDASNGQLSFARIFPNSATVVIAVDENADRLSIGQYLERIDYGEDAVIQEMTLNDYPFATATIPVDGLADYYFEFPNNSILAAYTNIGNGDNREFLAEEIRYIIGSIRYDEAAGEHSIDLDKESFLSQIRKKILIEGEGQAALDLFNDLLLIETDSVGIGTGPIDYYYSEEYDVTLKFERNSDTLHAMTDGQNTAF